MGKSLFAFHVDAARILSRCVDAIRSFISTQDGKYGKKIPSGVTMRDARRWEISKMAIVDGELTTTSSGAGYAFESWTLDDATFSSPSAVEHTVPLCSTRAGR